MIPPFDDQARAVYGPAIKPVAHHGPANVIRRLLFALPVVLIAQFALAASVLAAPPDRDGGKKPPKPTPPPVARGYDISYPQCGAAYPANPAFAMVGVNGGRVFSVNSCLASQIAWGGGPAAGLYANTGNPGPALSTFWPKGQTTPRFCDANNADTADCAFDYGWNAAQQSVDTATAAYQQLGYTASPAASAWWLDVETANSWRSDRLDFNVASLQGAVAYLQSVGVAKIGFYSTTYQWGVITGGSKVFSPMPVWGAGSSSLSAAQSLCASTTTSFTGGPLTIVQYPYNGFDADVRC